MIIHQEIRSAIRILKKLGNYKTSLIFACIGFLSLFAVGTLEGTTNIITFLIIASSTASIVSLCLDIFIEHDSANIVTGNIRGIYLTLINTAWLISPFLAGLLASKFGYEINFLTASLIMLPVIYVIYNNVKNFQDREYKDWERGKTIKELFVRKDVKSIMASNFLLQFFYS